MLTWTEVWQELHNPLIYVPMFAAMLLALAGSYIGVYVVLKRVVFVGAAMAQLTAAGVALGSLVAGTTIAVSPLGRIILGQGDAIPLRAAGWVTAVGVAMFSQGGSGRRLSRESIIGAVYLAAFAAMYLFSAKSAQGLEEVQHLLKGDVLTITADQNRWIAVITIAACATLFALGRQILLVSFDAETARASGYRVRGWELLFFAILGVLILLAIRYTGAMLIFAYLVIPPIAALRVANSMRAACVVSIAVGLLGSVLGFAGSLRYDLPTTFCIIAAMTVAASVVSVVAAIARR